MTIASQTPSRLISRFSTSPCWRVASRNYRQSNLAPLCQGLPPVIQHPQVPQARPYHQTTTMSRPAKRHRMEEPEAQTPESLQRSITPPRKKDRKSTVVKSPWQLTWIRDLPEGDNQDAVTLKDLLSDPLISECWEFNFLHDIPFLMDSFDPDTRHLVKVHLVHGFWKREDANRIALEVSCRM